MIAVLTQIQDFKQALRPVVIHNEENNEIVIFAVNRSEDEDMELTVELQGYNLKNITEFKEMSGFDVKQTNTKDDDFVKPRDSQDAEVVGGQLTATLKSLSWNMIRIGL